MPDKTSCLVKKLEIYKSVFLKYSFRNHLMQLKEMPQISFNIVMQMLVLLIKEVNVMAKKLKVFLLSFSKKSGIVCVIWASKCFEKKCLMPCSINANATTI